MLTDEKIEAAWDEVKLSPWPLQSVELNQTVRHKFARAVEKAACAPLERDIAVLMSDNEAQAKIAKEACERAARAEKAFQIAADLCEARAQKEGTMGRYLAATDCANAIRELARKGVTQ